MCLTRADSRRAATPTGLRGVGTNGGRSAGGLSPSLVSHLCPVWGQRWPFLGAWVLPALGRPCRAQLVLLQGWGGNRHHGACWQRTKSPGGLPSLSKALPQMSEARQNLSTSLWGAGRGGRVTVTLVMGLRTGGYQRTGASLCCLGTIPRAFTHTGVFKQIHPAPDRGVGR